jgi:hypothetical protein
MQICIFLKVFLARQVLCVHFSVEYINTFIYSILIIIIV